MKILRITKKVTSEYFLLKSLGYMLNNIHSVALHVFDVHSVFFCNFQSRSSHLVKWFDAIMFLMVLSFEFARLPIKTIHTATQS